MEAIRTQGLYRTYGKVEALKPLDLTVEQGSVFGFLGRNGAGKTTTIRLLTGLAQPTGGKAWVDGIRVTNGGAGVRARFGYMPEVPAFYNWMTPKEFLEYIDALFKNDESDRKIRIDELLDLTGLEDVAKRKIGGFSRGMRQRLGLAQALINRPPVLFLDEPTSALDPAGRKAVLDLIDQLRGTTTIFLSSHILADIERVCDTVAVIHKGQLLLVSDRDELMARYQSNAVRLELDSAEEPATAAFIAFLEQLPWVTTVEQEGVQLKLNVSDTALAKGLLLPIVVEHNISLSSYEWIRPTLEEVFLSISDVQS